MQPRSGKGSTVKGVRLRTFLEERSRDPFARLSGEAALRQRLGRSRRLQRFEDATHQSFRELVPKLFQMQP